MTRSQSQPCADAGTHIPRSPEEPCDLNGCDCEAPEPYEGVALVSEDCPIHGGRPELWS